MIYVGIDDTDVADSRGTNQLARAIVQALAADPRCLRIVRHQLLDDPRVPYTSKNGSASIALEPRGETAIAGLIHVCRDVMREWFVAGSDPGLCVATVVPAAVVEFGRRCQRELIAQSEPRLLAADTGLHLEGLGGTEDGVIGALAAVGLAATGDDGRIVQLGEWPDDLTGMQPIDVLNRRDVEVIEWETGARIRAGCVDVGKKLRPNLRQGRAVLSVRRALESDGGLNSGDNDLCVALKLT